MRKFLINLLLFFIPLILVIAILEYGLHFLGESTSIEEVLKKQEEADPEVLFMRGVVSQDYNVYKVQGIKKMNPKVLVLGSSRVMQFRSTHFRNDVNFYNAGGILQCAHDLIAFKELVKEKYLPTPDLLIVGLDPWWFKVDAQPTSSWLESGCLEDHSKEFKRRPFVYLNMLKSIVRKGLSVKSPQNIGLYAKKKSAGFRLDGSKSIEPQIISDYRKNPQFVDREVPPVNLRIQEGLTNRFSVSPPDRELAGEVLEALKELANEVGELVIYLPPFSSESYELIHSSEMHREWWFFLANEFYPELNSVTPYIIKIESPKTYSLPDDYFIDGFHPSEVFVGLQLMVYGNDIPPLGLVLNTEIQDLFDSAETPLSYGL